MWADLYDQHEATRDVSRHQRVDNLLRLRLRALAARGACDPMSAPLLTYRKKPPRGKREIWIATGANAARAPDEVGTIEIETDKLADAQLSISVLLDHGETRVEKYTIRLEGRDAADQPRLISVELDGEPMGSGACGHPLLHCHIGPDHATVPEVRVPVAAMRPWEALDWVLSVVIPNWEPLPWTPSGQAGPADPADWREGQRAWAARTR